MIYTDFLKNKRATIKPVGFEVDDLNPMLFEFQHDFLYDLVWCGSSSSHANALSF